VIEPSISALACSSASRTVGGVRQIGDLNPIPMRNIVESLIEPGKCRV